MTHVFHDGLPRYDARNLLHDGCPECEERSREPMLGILNLDPANLHRLWTLMVALKYDGVYKWQPSDATLRLVQAAYEVSVVMQRGGMPPRAFLEMLETG